MRLAIHLPLSAPGSVDASAAARHLEDAARTLGWTARLCRFTHAVEDFAPDCVLALDPFTAKLTAHPWIGWLEVSPEHFRWDWPRLSRVLSFDGWITASPACADFLEDIFAPTVKRAPTALIPSGRDAADTPVGALAALPDLLARVRKAGGFSPSWSDAEPPDAGVDYVVRVGSRDRRFLQRCFASLAAQTAGTVGLVVVRHAAVDGLDAVLDAVRDRLRRMTVIDIPAGAARSTALWAGIDAVAAPFFGMLDDDDALHPNHVATLLPILRDHRTAIAYSGSVRVFESPHTLGRSSDPATENRDLFGLDPARPDRLAAWRLRIHSSAFIARTALRPEIGPDPRLHVIEDAFLIRRLARAGALVPSWRPTTDFFWRETRDDNTAFDPSCWKRTQLRITDRERLDPVMARMRGMGDLTPGDHDQGPTTFWGDPADGSAPRWPAIGTPADVQALPGGVPLYVCGTGTGARIVRAEIEKFDHLRITAFVDSFRTGLFGAYPVVAPDDIPEADRSRAVAVVASQHVHEIAARLVPLGFRDIRDASPYILSYVDLHRSAQR